MKQLRFTLLLPVALLFSTGPVPAQTAPPAAAPETQAPVSFEKHIKPIVSALKLEDAAQAAKVHDLLAAQFAAWKTWHAQNDARLKELWAQYNKARGTKDQKIIDAAMAKIDDVYATFQPQHDAFRTKLAALLTPAQIETVEDVLTVNKVKVTFHAYGQIFSGLTDAQKAFILEKLKAAREEAIDAGSMAEKSAFFKKYKDQIEAYLTAQGYDVKQAYKDFVAKQKAEAAARKAAKDAASGPTDKKQ